MDCIILKFVPSRRTCKFDLNRLQHLKMINFVLQMFSRGRLQIWFACVCFCILSWTCLVHLLAMGQFWHVRLLQGGNLRMSFTDLSGQLTRMTYFTLHSTVLSSSPPPMLISRVYRSNGYLKVSCNGGLNQMRAAICDMVTVARLLNLTLVVPELDKTSFWSDHSHFADIFDVRNFIDGLRDEVHIIKRLPKLKNASSLLIMSPVSWSNETYYLQQILPLFRKYDVIHFNKTDTRLANNGLSVALQRLRCRVNYHVLQFTAQIEDLGNKLIQTLQEKGPFVALHLRYEMDMLAFSGCTHGCSNHEAEELKKMRYTYPWWREKEIVSEEKRIRGLCPLTPEEVTLVLKALGYGEDTRIYIASGEIYGGDRRLVALKTAFPLTVRKETLLDSRDLEKFQSHSSQMAALDYLVSISSDTFIPTYSGNMAKIVEGHRRYLGHRKTLLLNRRKLVELLDLHHNKTITWDEFAVAVKEAHEKSMGQPMHRKVIAYKPKEEDYFYSNPEECM